MKNLNLFSNVFILFFAFSVVLFGFNPRESRAELDFVYSNSSKDVCKGCDNCVYGCCWDSWPVPCNSLTSNTSSSKSKKIQRLRNKKMSNMKKKGFHTKNMVVSTAAVAKVSPTNELSSNVPSGGHASMYQKNGFNGTVPMKLTTKMVNGNEVRVMKLASKKMNQKMTWEAKLFCDDNMTYNHFEVQTANGPKSFFPPNQNTGQNILGTIIIKPWSLNTVENQCKSALTKANGTYKKEATILLQPTTVDLVRFDASCKYDGNNNIKQYSGKVKPKTKVKCSLTNPPYVPEG